MRFYFTRISRNKKTGPIPVVTASKDTCPPTCPLMGGNGCYAEQGPLAIVWSKCTLTLEKICQEVRRLPKGQLWRYGQAGDLPPKRKDLDKLVEANRGRPVLCYTHSRRIDDIKAATAAGFHVNISADSVCEAEKFAQQGLSTVVVLPSSYGRHRSGESWTETLPEYKTRTASMPKYTPDGVRLAVCPATYHDISCDRCGICARPRKNGTIVGFPAHGSKRGQIDRRLSDVRRSPETPATRPRVSIGNAAVT
jgi:hypothetical protein